MVPASLTSIVVRCGLIPETISAASHCCAGTELCKLTAIPPVCGYIRTMRRMRALLTYIAAVDSLQGSDHLSLDCKRRATILGPVFSGLHDHDNRKLLQTVQQRCLGWIYLDPPPLRNDL